MIRSLWIAKTGMEAQQTQLDTISNNLANVGTNGYKRGHVVFEDLMYQNLRQAGAASSRADAAAHRPAGRPGRARRWPRRATSARATCSRPANNLDVAIKGHGFFQIQLPDGTTGYTRDGSFQVDAQRPARHQQRLPGAARHHDPGQRAERDHRARRHGQRRAAGPGHAAGRRASCSWPTSSTRPASSRKGQNLFAETAASGTPQRRRAGQQRPGHAAAGLSSRPATSTWSRSWCR